MLVLSRKEAETILIGDIEVTVVRISGNRVTLAIKADKEIRILRGELHATPHTQKLKGAKHEI